MQVNKFSIFNFRKKKKSRKQLFKTNYNFLSHNLIINKMIYKFKFVQDKNNCNQSIDFLIVLINNINS